MSVASEHAARKRAEVGSDEWIQALLKSGFKEIDRLTAENRRLRQMLGLPVSEGERHADI